jgi:glycosyltransferase involved in cell wall biosynthesis
LTKQEKINFISGCDAMLHARSDGESFGLSICEFLSLNKPVISFGGGRDKNNVSLLNKFGMIYNNQYELLECIMKVKYRLYGNSISSIVDKFSAETVMEQFDKVFLQY